MTAAPPAAAAPEPAAAATPPRAGTLGRLTPLWLLLLPALFFWPALTLQGAFYFGDLMRLHLPLKTALADALTHGELPLWSSSLMAGYPIFAEGQVGALYPLNLLLAALVPAPAAINAEALTHMIVAALGMYAFARTLGAGRFGALLGGIAYAGNACLIAHLGHLNLAGVAAWIPWSAALSLRLLGAPKSSWRLVNAAGLAAVLALQALLGHPQTMLIGLMAVGVLAAWWGWTACFGAALRRGPARQSRGVPVASPFTAGGAVRLAWRRVRPALPPLGLLVAGVGLGLGLASVQLVPSFELTRRSIRAAGVDPTYFTTFSLPPWRTLGLVYPFPDGDPFLSRTPAAGAELAGYPGLLTLALAAAALWQTARGRGHRYAPALAALVLGGLALAWGGYNPLYALLVKVPVLNLFRVPARYLLLVGFGLAALAALGADALLHRLGVAAAPAGSRGSLSRVALAAPWLLGVGLAALVVTLALSADSSERLVAIWRWLPLAMATAALTLVAGRARGWLGPRPWAALTVGFLVADLWAFAAVFGLGYNRTLPFARLIAPPAVAASLPLGDAPYRSYVVQSIVPATEVMLASLYPNLGLKDHLATWNADLPLPLLRWAQLDADLKEHATLLDRLAARWIVIPQLLPDDEATEQYKLDDPFAPNLAGRHFDLTGQPQLPPGTRLAAVTVESWLSHSTGLPDGAIVARLRFGDAEGHVVEAPLLAGRDTAEWAYARPDVAPQTRHTPPPAIRRWPAASGAPPVAHAGQTYQATLTLPEPIAATWLEIVPVHPAAYMRIERLALVPTAGPAVTLSALGLAADHTLAYRSQDAAVYENHTARPRANLVHRAQLAASDADARALIAASRADDAPTAVVEGATLPPLATPSDASSERTAIVAETPASLSLRVSASADAILVLADAAYPGWEARVDGQAAPILNVDYLFRGVALGPGNHTVEFRYEPTSLRLGLALSAAAGLVWLALLAVAWRLRATGR